MNRARAFWSFTVALLCVAPTAFAQHRGGLDVELWTDRGQDAVYRPGEPLEVRVRTSDDAYLLVYEIDAEGNVLLIAPEVGTRGYVPGGETFQVPSPRSDMELVVEGPVGQGFLVAIASRDPFHDLPWYLRPYNAQADDIGYAGGPEGDEEEGVTAQGRIVGDPYVAMERIRRRVLDDPNDEDSFATAYTAYYVGHQVRYPRYMCYDCHRPNRWAWWDGFDPYYTTCSVMDFRVNWAWGWGPAYWYGSVPYYYYVYRADCPPRYRMFTTRDACFSSWDGSKRWRKMWGGSLVRYKSAPPPGYVAPNKFDERTRGERRPPGFLAGGRNVDPGRRAGLVPLSRDKGNSDRWWRGDRPTTSSEARRSTNGWREVGLGRRDASASGKDQVGGLGRREDSQRRPNGLRELLQPRERSQPRERPEWSRERSLPRFERPSDRLDQGRERLRSEESRSGWTRERSQPRFEQPRVEQPRERSQPRPEAREWKQERPAPRESSRPRSDDGGRGGGRSKEESGGRGHGR